MISSEVDIAISKDQISGMPSVTFDGEITVVDTPEQAEAALQELRRAGIVGFDTETRPSFRKGHINTVSLIQMSTGDHCYLFRLINIGFVDCLKDFFEDANVMKIGLSLRDDFHVLHKIRDFEPAGFVDLQDMVHNHQINDLSLQKIYAIIFGHRISKSQRLSNWEAKELTPSQQQYASIDAWACLRIYKHLTSGKFDPETSPYHQPEIIPNPTPHNQAN